MSICSADGQINQHQLKIYIHPDQNVSMEIDLFNDVFKDYDAFGCLCKLRQKLERQNLWILCNGARIDCYPSGMCREMGCGFSVYELQLGVHAKRENLVKTFDYAPLNTLATVKQQYERIEPG